VVKLIPARCTGRSLVDGVEDGEGDSREILKIIAEKFREKTNLDV